jgi:hypothetical protein
MPNIHPSCGCGSSNLDPSNSKKNGKHKICKLCIYKILSERAAGAWIPCPVFDCHTGKVDIEDVRYDVVVTPERGSPSNSKTG